MNKHMFEQTLKKSVVGVVAASMIFAGLPVHAASISSFKLMKDTVVLDGNRTTGEYINLQYAVNDTAGINSVGIEVAPAAFVGDTSGAAAITLNTTLAPVGFVNEVNNTVKIDPDFNATTFTANTIKRLTLVVVTPAGTKRSSPVYVTVYGDMKIANFDVDGRTQANADISPIIIKQNGTSTGANTGDKLLVTKSFVNNPVGSSTLIAGSKQIDLSLGATATVDGDLLPVGKYSVRLKAYARLDKKTKEVLSSNSVPVVVLAQPKVARQSVDTVATQDGVKDRDVFTSSLTGDDKMVVKWDAYNLTKLKIEIYNGATLKYSKELTGGSANGINKTIAIDSDYLTKGAGYTVKLTGYNTDDYVTGTWTSAAATIN